jgi:hypothetical protein
MIVIDRLTPIQCADCGDTITPEQMLSDEVRVHKTRAGLLCECCYEDYLDRNSCED